MWSYRLAAPAVVERVEVPDDQSPLGAGEVRLRTRVAGLCGSDMPRYTGLFGQFGGGFDRGAVPVHEILGTVVESASSSLAVGTRVVGTLPPTAGLEELVRVSDDRLFPVPDELSDVEGIAIQPLSTVLRALDQQLPPVAGKRAAVLGAGPCGLAFCHVLRHHGAASVEVVDRIERREVAARFGATSFIESAIGDWQRSLGDAPRPEIVVEAVGHQQRTIGDAIRAVASRGYVFGFGAPDDDDYVFPWGEIYDRDLTVASGRTLGDWPELLRRGAQYLLAHREDFSGYVSHALSPDEAQRAYDLYAKPQPGRLKVVLVAGD